MYDYGIDAHGYDAHLYYDTSRHRYVQRFEVWKVERLAPTSSTSGYRINRTWILIWIKKNHINIQIERADSGGVCRFNGLLKNGCTLREFKNLFRF